MSSSQLFPSSASSSSPFNNLTSQPPAPFADPIRQLLRQLSFAAVPSLLVGAALIYAVNYAAVTRRRGWQNVFTVLALGAFAFAHFGARVDCPPFASFKNCPIAIGVLKLLDMYMRRDAPLKYRHHPHPGPKPLPVPKTSESSDSLTIDTSPSPSPPLNPATHAKPSKQSDPPAWYQSLLLLTQLRYESFTPNPIRTPPTTFSEPISFIYHLAFFVLLQHLPQDYAVVIAFEVNISVYIIFTGFQLLLRFRDSPPIMSPLYTADSIAGFWTETWHNAFSSPCTSIAYDPVRNLLQELNVPRNIARSIGLISAFGLMAVFHIYCLYPVLPPEGTVRVGLFFMINGIATAVEVGIWGRKRHWVRRVLAWAFEVALATWVAEATRVPKGLRSIRWAEICGVPPPSVSGFMESVI